MSRVSPRAGVGLLLVLVISLAGCDGPSTSSTRVSEQSNSIPASRVELPPAARAGESRHPGPSSDGGSDAADLRPSFRPPDERPQHDATRLADHGIREYRSQRLILYTDIETAAAERLPGVIDAVFEQWVEYFGDLAPARDGSDYQLTGYLMRDQNRFREAGLLPVTLPEFAHGKHDAQQFWMNDSEFDYYRRHLMIHEATHCFMQSMGGTSNDVPVWYLEGMAELFATHTLNEDGTVAFRVMPQSRDRFVGFGRIPMLQRAVADGRVLSLNDISQLKPDDFRNNNESYAWAWAVCLLLDQHPRYRDAFRTLGRVYVGEQFGPAVQRLFGPVMADLETEWDLFARHVSYGYDVERAAIEFISGTLKDAGQLTVAADRGWQSSGMTVTAGQNYLLAAEGRLALAPLPKPWDSEPQGISIRYSESRPIGRLVGMIISEPDPQTDARQISDVIDLGPAAPFEASITGTLYLRVNDFWNELADNSGEYTVTIGIRPESN